MENLNQYIDHTLLRPEVNEKDMINLCREAKEYGFAAVCVNPVWVALCQRELEGTPVKIATVVGFPLGANTSRTKAFEAKEAVGNGASEIDMVMNVGAMKSGHDSFVQEDIEAVVRAVGDEAIVKVILETGLLTDREIERACQLAVRAGAHYVKTSTGFGPGGATVELIKRMRRAVGPELGVKASGGVRDWETAMAMIKAGASRIGTSSAIAIVTGSKAGRRGY